MSLVKVNDFTWWLNLTQSTNIKDNQFTIAKNVYYNNAKQLQTRRWYATFGDPIGSDPATSYFFYQRDDTLENIAVCHSWDTFYTYNSSSDSRDSVYANNIAYETLPWKTTQRTRWDYAVYKNVIYMCDGVNPYQKYDGTTHSLIWVSSLWTCTANNTTDKIALNSHGLSDNDEVYITTSGTMPTWLTAYQVYYVTWADTNDFQVTTTKNGTAIDFTTNGTGTLTLYKLTEPRIRYIQYQADRLYGAGDDANPSTLYYTNAAPSDWTNINQNVVVVWWDEAGRINGLGEYLQVPVVFKDQKSYVVDIATPAIETIDSQTGWYSDRTIQSINNTLVYFNERGIDALTKRTGVGDTSAIESQPLTEDVRKLTELVEEQQYNANCAWYIKKINNYYFTFDTNNDNRPDTTLVYNSAVKARTQYTFPPIYDYGYYINSSNEYQYLFSHASGWQFYQYEYGFDDAGVDIDVEVQTKDFDFWEPAQEKLFGYVEVVGYKEEWNDITVSVLIDGETSWSWLVNDTHINTSDETGAIWVSVIWVDPLGSLPSDANEWIIVYPYTVRLPIYQRWKTIAVNLSSTGVQWILEKMRFNVNNETYEVFSYWNII
jgi:hypothetical protein